MIVRHNTTFLPAVIAPVLADLLVCGFSALRAEKPHTIEKGSTAFVTSFSPGGRKTSNKYRLENVSNCVFRYCDRQVFTAPSAGFPPGPASAARRAARWRPHRPAAQRQVAGAAIHRRPQSRPVAADSRPPRPRPA